MTTEKLPEHSPLGGSGASRWSECPASAHISAKLAPKKSSPFAEEGTKAHAHAAKWLATGTPPLGLDDDTFEAINIYVETVNSVLNEHRDDQDLLFMIEEKFRLKKIERSIPMYGTADAVIWIPGIKHLHVFDYKHGVGIPVSVYHNRQLLYYALGAWYKLGRSEVELITVWIVQPRCYTQKSPVNHWTFGIDELIEFEKELVNVIDMVENEPDRFSAGPWCHFCPVAGMCREQMRSALAATGVVYKEGRFEMSNEGTLTDTEIAELFQALPELKTWVKRVEEAAYERNERGDHLPGLKTVAGRRRRRWTDEEVAQSAITALWGLNDIHEVKLLSPAKVEARLGRGNKKEMEKLDGLIEWTEGAPRLAPLSDPRPPIESSMKQAMEGLANG